MQHCSLHKYGEDFFPGTGALKHKGSKEGEGYSLNVPLHNGITDEKYFDELFKPILDKIMEVFQPGAIFLQCGADSLAADRLGTFNLTTRGHARMVEYVKSKHIPLLVSGGGGYTVKNVARVWCYETAVLCDKSDIPNEIPFHEYYEYFAPTYDLHLLPEHMENLNSNAEIDNIRSDLLQQVQDLQGAPGVAMQYVPPLFQRAEEYKDDDYDDGEEEVFNEDIKTAAGRTKKKKTKRKTKKQHPSEFYDNVD